MTKLVTFKAPGRKMIFEDCKANGLQLRVKRKPGTCQEVAECCVATSQMILSSQPEQRGLCRTGDPNQRNPFGKY